MKKFITIFFSLLLILVVGIAVFIFTFDINTYKSRIEKALSDASGYTFVIAGQIKATRSLEPIVSISDLKVKASPEFENEYILVAKNATVRLDLKSLIQDTIVIHSIDLNDVNVTLSVDDQGFVNWLPNSINTTPQGKRPALKKPVPSQTGQKDINIATIKASKVNVNYENKQDNNGFSMSFPQITIQQLLNFSGNAVFRKENWKFTGTIRNLTTVIKTQKNLNFSFDVSSSLGKGKLSGACRDLTACQNDFTLNIDFAGDCFDRLWAYTRQEERAFSKKEFSTQSKLRLIKESLLMEGTFTLGKDASTLSLSYNIEQDISTKSSKGRIELNVGDASLSRKYGLEPFSVKTNYTSENGKVFDFSNIASMFNETDIDGILRVDLTTNVPDINADLHSHYFKLANVLYSEEKEVSPKQKNTDKVFSDQPIDWSILKKFNGNASIVIDNLSVANMLSRYPQVLLKAKLTDGLLTVDLGEGSYFAGGQVVGKAIIKAQEKDAIVDVSAVADGLEFSQVIPWKKVLRSGNVNGNIFLKTKGSSIASLLRNLDGNVLFTLNQVDITSPIIGHLSTENASAMSRASQELVIKCGVINTSIEKGMISLLKNIAFETSKFNMIIDGTINLADETLSLHLLPQTNKSDRFSRITQGVAFEGSFTNPKSKVIEQKVSQQQSVKSATVPMSEKQAFLDSYTKKAPLDDTSNSICRIAMGTSVLKDIDAYFGRQKVIEPTEKAAPTVKKEEVSKAQMIGRGLLDSLSDALSNESNAKQN